MTPRRGVAYENLSDMPSPRQQSGLAVLFLLALAILGEMMSSSTMTAVLTLVGAGALFVLGFSLLYTGFAIESAVKIGDKAFPVVPRKTIGSCVVGVTAAIVAMQKTGVPLHGVQFAIATATLSMASFGLDPVRWRSTQPTSEDRLTARLDLVVSRLELANEAVRQLRDPELTGVFTRYQTAVLDLVRAVRAAPERNRSVRRHLGPFIDGALDAGRTYLQIANSQPNPDARAVIMGLLTEFSQEYEAATRDYCAGNSEALLREAEVMHDMLARVRRDQPEEA